jgi:hypothetical protein
MSLDQMVVAAKHAPDLTASRRVQRFENANKNVLALHPLARCSFNIAHR